MRMRRNWSKRLTALMLAILAFAALGTVALADETDPEKDLVIGSEYGGGGSPDGGSGGGTKGEDPNLSEDQAAILTKWLEGHFEGDGVLISEQPNDEIVSIDYGMGEQIYDDGSTAVTVMFTNYFAEDIPLHLSISAENANGVVMEAVVGSGYEDGFILKAGYRRAFQIFVENGRYSKIHCVLTDYAKDVENAKNEPFKFDIRTGIEDVKTVVVKKVHEPSFLPGVNSGGYVSDCEGCGIGNESDDELNAEEHFWVYMLVGIAVVVGIAALVILILRRKTKQSKEK